MYKCRHGIRQLRSGWADGPSYVTQCPIRMGQSYVYNFTVTGQRGTLWWHAHIQWMRATVYGPLIILPKLHQPYPFPKPYKQVPILFGNYICFVLLVVTFYLTYESQKTDQCSMITLDSN